MCRRPRVRIATSKYEVFGNSNSQSAGTEIRRHILQARTGGDFIDSAVLRVHDCIVVKGREQRRRSQEY